jgi:hypothetical protein
MNVHEKYGPIPPDRDAFKRQCRLLQCWYRVEVLKIKECGPWQPNANCVGSSLLNAESSGANFMSRAAFEYAKERVADKQQNADLTIDEFRLFNNMLSSMPMCFNLFSDFRVAIQSGDSNANHILTSIFSTSPISRVTDVVVEMIPQPISDYIDDKTAWDAAVFYTDADGKQGLASIETKYTDKLGANRASKQRKKFDVAERLGIFTEKGLDHYASHGFDQVARNLLLTLAYADKHQLSHAKNYVLSPADDREAPAAVAQLRERLSQKYADSIELLSLETVVERGLQVAGPTLAEHLKRFHRRYLDFSQIAHL